MVEEGGFRIKRANQNSEEILSEPKQTYIDDHGNKFLLEKSINGDVAIIKAWKADKRGNLIFRKTARNFN